MLLNMLLDFLDEFNTSERSGFQVGPSRFLDKKIVTGLVLTLNPEIDVLNFARKSKSNLVLCFHPLIHSNINQIDEKLSKDLYILLRNHIWVYFMESPVMISETLANVLSLNTDNIILTDRDKKINNPLRICTFNKTDQNFDTFLNDIKRRLALNSFRYIRSKNPSLGKIGLALNNDFNKNSIIQLFYHGCSCILTNNMNYFHVVLAKKLDLSIIEIPHTSFYNPWIQKLTKIVSLKFPRLNVTYYNSEEIIRTYR